MRGHPDEFLLRDVCLYEMPDGLWYPLSNHTWDAGEAKPLDDILEISGPLILEAMTDFSRRLRAMLRDAGFNRIKAYREARYHATGARGFHKSRVESDFDLIALKDWRARIAELTEKGDSRMKSVHAALVEFKSKKDESLKIWERLYRSKGAKS